MVTKKIIIILNNEGNYQSKLLQLVLLILQILPQLPIPIIYSSVDNDKKEYGTKNDENNIHIIKPANILRTYITKK